MIRLTSFLWVWFQCVCPLMPSCNTYHLTWISLTLGVGYLITAAPAKRSCCSLPWKRSHTSQSFKFTDMFGLWTYYWTQIWLLSTWRTILEKTSASRNGKVALFRSIATWGDGRLLSKSQLQRFCLIMKVFLLLLLFVFVIMKTFKRRIIWGVYQHLHYLPLCADFLLIGWW